MAEYVTAISTSDGVKQIDFNYLANKPTATSLGCATLKHTHDAADISGLQDELDNLAANMSNANDPFLWRTVEIVPYNNKDNYTTIVANGSGDHAYVYCNLPVSIDFSKYKYQFTLDVFGLQQYNRESGYVSHKLCPYISSTDVIGEMFISAYDTESESKRAEHLSFPSVFRTFATTDANNYTISFKQGWSKGEIVTGNCATSGSANSNISFEQVVMDFYVGLGSKYPVETFGILFSYRAYASK